MLHRARILHAKISVVQAPPADDRPWLTKADEVWSNKGPIWAVSDDAAPLSQSQPRAHSAPGASTAHASNASSSLDGSAAQSAASKHQGGAEDSAFPGDEADVGPFQSQPLDSASDDGAINLLTGTRTLQQQDEPEALSPIEAGSKEAHTGGMPASNLPASSPHSKQQVAVGVAADEMPRLQEKLLQERQGHALAALHAQQVRSTAANIF